ncbi:putative ubiquitin carboxyl-terminal hydrolase MINDY-4 [Aulostomus maculatus]
MVVTVEEVSASLVREYLSRKGLKRTISCMDEEHPRSDSSINNRTHLRQVLHIEDLYRVNKVQKSPLRTLLEIVVKHHVEGCENDKRTCKKSDSLQEALTISSVPNSPAETASQMNAGEQNQAEFVTSNYITLRSHVKDPPQPASALVFPDTDGLTNHFSTDYPKDQKVQPPMASLQHNESLTWSQPERKTSMVEQRSRPNRMRRGMMTGPIASTLQESNKKRPSRRVEVPRLPLRKEEETRLFKEGLSATGFHPKSFERCSTDHVGSSRQEWGSAPDRAQRENSFDKGVQGRQTIAKSWMKPHIGDMKVSEMVLDDIDDDDDLRELSKVSLQQTVTVGNSTGCSMDQHTAAELKVVLLGSCLSCFSVEWTTQGFTFSETHDLRYGIVQKKGGPCGVLATVQAFVLKKLLFENIESSNTVLQSLRPSNTARRKCLVLAAAEILWRAGEEKQATIAIITGRNSFTPTGRYKSEGVLEKIIYFTLDNMKDLQALLEQHIEQFETGRLGCLLLTISAILSRSVEKVRKDMDVSTATLIAAHGYCTQELVNLLLCGRAVSNVFDDDVELDSGNGTTTLLKGIKGHCNIGLLSLFEHYNICKVGTRLKTPLYPIWVVCSESHFSVLFGLQRELLTNRDKVLEFDLYYYDGLANQQEEIRLTVSVGRSASSCQDVDADLVPPLEHCIRTRWNNACVSWNDTEPIL